MVRSSHLVTSYIPHRIMLLYLSTILHDIGLLFGIVHKVEQSLTTTTWFI